MIIFGLFCSFKRYFCHVPPNPLGLIIEYYKTTYTPNIALTGLYSLKKNMNPNPSECFDTFPLIMMILKPICLKILFVFLDIVLIFSLIFSLMMFLMLSVMLSSMFTLMLSLMLNLMLPSC